MAALGKIYLNYRRGDDPGMTGRLYDRLRAALHPDQLFMDVEGGISAGADFVDVLRDEISKSDVLLVVIGRQWFAITDESGKPRLDNPKDFVRIEIRAAIEQQKHIIPVLVGGAAMPTSEQLPEDLQPLSRRHAVRLTHERFQADCSAFVDALLTELPNIVVSRQKRVENEMRQAAEVEQLREVADKREVELQELRDQLRKAEAQMANVLCIIGNLRDELLLVKNRSELHEAFDRVIVGIGRFEAQL